MGLNTEPFWWKDGAALPPVCRDVPTKADMVVVGAGFTGLGAALAAVDKGADVVVFDAGQPGQGASTRNGGMIGAPHRPEFVSELKTYGRDLAARIVREGAEGYAYTRGLHEASGAFQHTGRVQMAFTRAHYQAMTERVRLIHELEPQETRLLSREELGAHIRSDLYFGGLYYPDHGAVQPRLAHDGLMKRARAAGVTVCAGCAVTAMRPEGEGFRLSTEGGEIWARRLVWATNGYTGTQSRWLARRIFRVPSFIVATEELAPGVIDRLAPGRRMMVESRARHSYFRPSPDGKRIIFGGRAALVSINEAEAARRLQQTMAEIWPEAAEWKLSHSWQGWLGFTFARNPYVGSHEGVHFAYGYSGNGVALSPWLGRKAALSAMGDPEGQSAFAETPLESRPYHIGGAPWFMALASPWWRYVVDARETARARRDRAARG